MKDKNKKKSSGQTLTLLIAIATGAALGILSMRMPDDLPYVLILLIYMYAAIFVHVIIHEAGHLVFGLLSGYSFTSFRIFSFMWIKENGKLRLKRLSLAGTAGQCLMTPPELVDGKMPVVLYNLGGSIMNLLTGGIFLVISLFCTEGSLVWLAMLAFSLIGVMTALMNGIPMRTAMIDNDGYNAMSLRENTEAMRAFWVQLSVASETAKGVRLKDMPAEWFELPSDEAMNNGMVAACGVFAANRLMEEGRLAEADGLMARLLDGDFKVSGLHRNLMTLDRIYFELIGEARRDVVDGMLTAELKKFMKTMKTFPSVIRVEYAIALIHENAPAKAKTILTRFDKCAKTYPYQNDIEAERELIKMAESRYS